MAMASLGQGVALPGQRFFTRCGAGHVGRVGLQTGQHFRPGVLFHAACDGAARVNLEVALKVVVSCSIFVVDNV